jgi:hypothetical protein
MTKDFNRDLDQSGGDKRGATAGKEGPRRPTKPDSDPKTARERQGDGFKNPADEYQESGSRGAGYRETSPKQDK